jgi:hypothetical protein
MRRIATLAVLVLVLMAMAVPAFAAPPDHANNLTCSLTGGGGHDDGGDDYTVGQFMQTLMARTYDADLHPAGVIVPMDTVIRYPSLGETVGDMIAKKCG